MMTSCHPTQEMKSIQHFLLIRSFLACFCCVYFYHHAAISACNLTSHPLAVPPLSRWTPMRLNFVTWANASIDLRMWDMQQFFSPVLRRCAGQLSPHLRCQRWRWTWNPRKPLSLHPTHTSLVSEASLLAGRKTLLMRRRRRRRCALISFYLFVFSWNIFWGLTFCFYTFFFLFYFFY